MCRTWTWDAFESGRRRRLFLRMIISYSYFEDEEGEREERGREGREGRERREKRGMRRERKEVGVRLE